MKTSLACLALGVGVVACTQQSQSAPSEPSAAQPSAAQPSAASAPAPAATELTRFERRRGGAWPPLKLELRGGGAREWALRIQTAERAQLEERSLVCPERWEERCWQAASKTGRVSPAALDELFAALGQSSDWQAKGPQPPGQALLMLELERDGARSRPLTTAATSEGAKIRQAAEKLRAAFVPDP